MSRWGALAAGGGLGNTGSTPFDWSSLLGPAGTIGGGILSGIGSLIGGQSANRAARRAGDEQDRRLAEQHQRLINVGYGGGDPNVLNRPGGSITPTPNSILGRLSSLAGYGEAQGQNILGGYDAASSRLANLAGGAEGMARDWGQGRDAVIRGDFDRALKTANRSGDAALAAAGFNSPTVRASQYAGNAANIGREQQRALQDLSEAQIDRQLGARTQNLNVQGARESGRTGLLSNLLSQNLNLRRAPIDTELQMAESSIANPYLSQNTSAYQGNSGLGSALTNLGGGLAAYGSYSLGQSNQAALLRQLLSSMGQAA